MKEIIRYFQFLLILLPLGGFAFKTQVFILNNPKKRERIYFKVPKKYMDKKSFYGDTLKSIDVVYNDSSIIYISKKNSKFLPNYYHIRYQSENHRILNNDTSILIYSGSFEQRAWKEIVYKNKFRIGYSNAPTEKIPLYDKSLLRSIPGKRRSVR